MSLHSPVPAAPVPETSEPATPSSCPVRIGILGAAGRMGRMLIQALIQADCQLGLAIEQPDSPWLGQDAGELAGTGRLGVALTSDLAAGLGQCDVLIDFTAPVATLSHLALCQQAGKPLVIGTTGLDRAQQIIISEAGQTLPIVYAANYSVGVNVSLKLLAMAAQALAADSDIEIIEAHHKHKVDAPSGTALMMGRAITDALGQDLHEQALYCREGHTGVRPDGRIGFQTIRGGDIVGEHTVMFIGEGERLEVRHIATSRMNFASGAVRAARWLAAQPAGCYDMQDVLGLRQDS